MFRACHQPGTAEIKYKIVFAALDAAGYKDFYRHGVFIRRLLADAVKVKRQCNIYV
jgi:hypothetical protein